MRARGCGWSLAGRSSWVAGLGYWRLDTRLCWMQPSSAARRHSHGGLRQRPILVNAKWVVAASRWCHKREKGAWSSGTGMRMRLGFGLKMGMEVRRWEAVALHKLKSGGQKTSPQKGKLHGAGVKIIFLASGGKEDGRKRKLKSY